MGRYMKNVFFGPTLADPTVSLTPRALSLTASPASLFMNSCQVDGCLNKVTLSERPIRPCQANRFKARPNQTLPRLTSPGLALPCPTTPNLAEPHLNSADHAT